MTRKMSSFNLSLETEYLGNLHYPINQIKEKFSFLKEQKKAGKRK